jgi:hypothetical protein
LLHVAGHRYVSLCDIATIYAALSQVEELEQRVPAIMALRHDPAFRELHPLPRFQRILRHLESPQARGCATE